MFREFFLHWDSNDDDLFGYLVIFKLVVPWQK